MNGICKAARAIILLLLLSSVLCSSEATADTKSLKEQIVGAWSLVAITLVRPSGKNESQWGRNVSGMVMFDAQGRFSWQIIGEPRPEDASKDPRRPDALLVSYFGTYAVNETEQTITYFIEHGSYSRNNGTQRQGKVSITGEIMEHVAVAPRSDQQGAFVPHLEFKRVPTDPALQAQVPRTNYIPDTW